MKNINLKKLALIGIASGIVLAQSQANAGHSWSGGDQKNTQDISDATDSSVKLTQSELEQKLNPETRKVFQSLGPDGKELALKLANQSCSGKNSCKGLNSCKTENNSCAGQGGCKGQSKGPFKDKNKAVMVAAKHMMDERLKSMSNS